MQPRIEYSKISPGLVKAMYGLEQYLAHCGVEQSLLEMIKLRVSQINGCAYCLDMHWKDLKSLGVDDQRLYSLDAWRETPFYSDRERAALTWAEALTKITEGHVPDAIYEEVRQQFSEKELADLALAIVTINSWNRLSIAFRVVPGAYQPSHAQESLASALQERA